MDESSILIAHHKTPSLVSGLRKVLDGVFDKPEDYYKNLPVDEYRETALQAQEEMNKHDMAAKVSKEIIEDLTSYLQTDEFLIQSNAYLRCSRPSLPTKQEAIGFHRETFYGANMEQAVNVWTPIRGVTKENTLQYIPESQLIPEDQIITTSEDDEYTERFSAGHKLGFLYKPKDIVSGVDLTKKQPMIVPEYATSIFSGNLIHGAAENYSDRIRFSCDFRIIRKKDYSNENKQFHVASGKPYFVEFK